MMQLKIRRQLTPTERDKFGAIDDITAHLLFHRGIRDHDSAANFMDPDYDGGVHDPFLLKDARKAAERVIKSIENNEKIAIYADYDADGIPGAAIFDEFLRRIGYENYTVYIPHRHNEGFGLNKYAVEELASRGVKLIVTIDCGITDISAIDRANELGLEVIITDHHEPPILDAGKKHSAFAIVDHRQPDCSYPDKNICGSGVIFKLVQAILKLCRFGLKDGMEKWMLDLVAIATLSDMVPLIGENRIFAKYGLQVLRKSQRKGLVAMVRKLKMDQRHLTEDDVAFMITPRINAASRMGVPMDAFHLLSAVDEAKAMEYAEHLDAINNERKGVVAALTKEVKKLVRDRHIDILPGVIVVGNPSWRPSLLGLVANSCAEEFDRPVFLWGRDGDGFIKGSCRSEGVTNVVELMRACVKQSFSQFGGHKHSGGFAVADHEVHYLEQRLNDAHRNIFETTSVPTGDKGIAPVASLEEMKSMVNDESGDIDCELGIDDVGRELFGSIDRLAPFGMANSKPVFLFRGISPVNVRIFGKKNDHVELVFKKKDDSRVSAISFFGATSDWSKRVVVGGKVDLLACVERSVYGGRDEIRLRISDVLQSLP